MVSDDVIVQSQWNNAEQKSLTIEKVITEHSYLKSAYTVLDRVEPTEKFYPYIKQMASRDRPFEDIEYALLGLARFKKPDDIAFIDSILLANTGRMTNLSFRIMREYPNNQYMDVLARYAKKGFYRTICMGHSTDEAGPFFKALAAYKNEKSAGILKAILTRKPFLPCPADSEYVKEMLCDAIWDNPCDAYADLIREIKPEVTKRKNHELTLPPVKAIIFPDSIRW